MGGGEWVGDESVALHVEGWVGGVRYTSVNIFCLPGGFFCLVSMYT